MQPFGRAISVLAVLAYTSTGVMGSNGLLCVGPDGHFEREVVCGSCCEVGGGPEGGSLETVALSPDGEDPCGPCIDLPLAGEHIQPRAPSVREVGPACPQAAIVVISDPAPATPTIGHSRPGQELPRSGPGDPRCIVFLC